MSCNQLHHDLHQALTDGPIALTPALRAHIEQCESCAAEFLRLQLLEQELGELESDYEPSFQLISDVLDRAESQTQLELAKSSRRDDAQSKEPPIAKQKSTPSEAAEGSEGKSARKDNTAAPRKTAAKRLDHARERRPARTKRRLRSQILMLGPLAAAAALLLVLAQMSSSKKDKTAPKPTTVTAVKKAGKALRLLAGAHRVSIYMGAGRARESTERSGKWQALKKGATTIALPATLRTNSEGPAKLAFPDGSELTLARETTIAFRSLQDVSLSSGKLLAEVTPRSKDKRLKIAVPTGVVEVVGTKFNLVADPDLAVVDVVRGQVRLIGKRGASVDVDAGQEGMLSAKEAPRAVMAPDLGRELSWADRGDHKSAVEPTAGGLGELTAKRPGRSKTRKLRLSKHSVSVRIQGDIARTEIRETFSNDSAHTLEGIYRFPLPAGARISRLALYVGKRVEEGTIVERGRARRIWRGVIRQATPKRMRKKEEYVWVPGPWKDPALLEWQRGNRFELRIYPIPARGSRTVILAYTETLSRTPRGRRYVYPLAHGGVTVGQFDVSMRLAGHDAKRPIKARNYALTRERQGNIDMLRFSARDFSPAGDLALDFATDDSPLSARSWTFGAAGGQPGYALLSLRPELPALASRRRPRKIVLLVDRSYSLLGEANRRQLMLVNQLLGELSSKDQVALVACDTRCKQINSFETPRELQRRNRLAALQRIKPGGASNLGHALTRAGQLLSQTTFSGDHAAAHVIYIGDGTATLGELERGRLISIVKRQLLSRGARLTTIGVGSAVDSVLLEVLARAGESRYVAFHPGATARGQALTALASLSASALSDATIELPAGLEQVAPARVPVVFRGEELRLSARLRGPVKGYVVLRGRVAGRAFVQRFKVDMRPHAKVGNSYLPRVWAQARIDDLASSESGTHRKEIVTLSKHHHLLSRHTSLLVLESEAMRRAFRVQRTTKTQQWAGLDAPSTDKNDDADAAGSSEAAKTKSLGTSGIRSIGGGAGKMGSFGRLRGKKTRKYKARRRFRPKTAPSQPMARPSARKADQLEDLLDGAMATKGPRTGSTYRPGTVTPPSRASTRVTGSLSKDVIRKVVRRNLPSVRAVYQTSLRRNPNLSARVVLRFTIGPTGHITHVESKGGSPQLAAGLRRVVSRWRFPAPKGGGSVTVSYPVVLRSAGGPSRMTRGRRVWVRHKRVWEQYGELKKHVRVSAWERRLIEKRRNHLAENPLSRDRTRALYRALSRAGDRAAALSVVQGWVQKEPRNREALRLYADALARVGKREQALRTLGSLLEIDSNNLRLHRRLERMARSAGDGALACAHRLSLGSLLGDSSISAGKRGIRGAANATNRAASCRYGILPGPTENAWGRVSLSARWNSPVDLDLAIIDSRGRRYSWLSASNRVRAARATDLSRERLALSWLPPGNYRIEIKPADGSVQNVRGRLLIRAPKLRESIRFQLSKKRYVAALTIKTRSRLVPAP
jgi:tetratricopeptide (TPR) repeat protein